MQNRVAVEADDVYVGGRQAMGVKQRTDRADVAFGQFTGDRFTARPALRIRAENATQSVAEVRLIGKRAAGPHGVDALAVGSNDRGIDAVEGRAAHQAEGGEGSSSVHAPSAGTAARR